MISLKQVVNDLKKILHSNENVVIACSGGPDSMCLVSLLLQIQKEKKINIICAHINHNRREESKDEFQFVKNYCEKNNIIFEGTEFKEYKKENFHKQAHQKRFEFYKQVIEKYQAKYFMTAHHGDDLIETILMRMTRGSSRKGYIGFSKIEKKETYTIIRPLIIKTKQEIQNYNDKNKIPYVIDKSNFSIKYTRNRYRKYVLPFLKKENPRVHKKFLQFQDNMCRINEFIVKFVNTALTKCLMNDTLLITEVIKLDPFLEREVIKSYLELIYQNDIDLINEMHLNLILEMIHNKKSNESRNLPLKRIAIKSYDTFQIKKANNIESYQIELKEEAKILGFQIKKVDKSEEKSNNILRLKKEEIEFPLYLRSRKHADKIEVKHLNGHQKVKDIFIDKKIPREQRDEWPILVDSSGNILWIPGVKKSKFDKEKEEKYDIIYKCSFSKEKKLCHEKIM